MKRIAVDLDSVCNELVPAWLNWYNTEWNDNVQFEDITSWEIDRFTRAGKNMYEFLSIPGVFQTLPIQENCYGVMDWLCTLYDVYIVSSWANRAQQVEDKVKWIKYYLPFFNTDNLIFCINKSAISADYMLDDGVHNLDTFSGTGLLYDRPWNQQYNHYTRLNNWDEVFNYFKELPR